MQNLNHIIRKVLLVCLFSLMALCSQGQSSSFARGADLSWATEMEADGRVFRNAKGEVTDIFALMKQIGMTAVRLRVWVDPTQYGYGSWSDKADVLAKAKRAHAQGLELMIDFHYSDFFADPGRQNIPHDWVNHSMEQLKTAIADHTKDVLQALQSEGISPQWVQVGNETNSGMLNPLGSIEWEKSGSERYANYVELSNAGYDAVKSVLPDAYVIIHLGGTENADWFFTDFKAAGGKFDMIGLSHYPTVGEWSSTSSSATHSNVNAAKWADEAAKKFGVPVMICETGFDVSNPTLASQIMKDLFARTRGVSQCAGIFYWEPEVDGVWRPAFYNSLGWGAYSMGAFTTDGRPTAALDAFKDDTSGIRSQQVSDTDEAVWYDLQGRMINDATKGVILKKRKQ